MQVSDMADKQPAKKGTQKSATSASTELRDSFFASSVSNHRDFLTRSAA